MRHRRLTTAWWRLLGFTLAVTACDPGARQQSSEMTPLPPEHVEQLMARWPVLRDTPAPEPKPSDAARPERVPAAVRETLPPRVLARVQGAATFYANRFEGRRTASGIPFRQNQLVAAHRAYPFGTVLRVTNLRNDRSVNVRVVDRGPHGTGTWAQRTVIDLSRRAAQELGFVQAGRAQVRVEVLEWGPGVRGAVG